MKKFLLSFIAACLFTFFSNGQYASVWSGYPLGYEVSAGFATQNTPGYFWLGYLPTVQNISTYWPTNKNFFIMGAGSSSIWSNYQIFDSQGCSGPTSLVLNGYGVSAIETLGPNNLGYALAGSYDKACYFATLDKFGNVLSAMSYPFPQAPSMNMPLPSKPILVESYRANEYFICGNYESRMYVISVTSTGAINWSSYYSLAIDMMPKDILMDPYHPGQVIVVGETSLNPFDKDGFMMVLDGASGNVVNAKVYGMPGVMDGFASVIAGANVSPANGAGFVIGGYTEKPGSPTQSNPWVIKLDPNGNITWTSLLVPTLGINKGVIDIVQRYNTFGNYEYYALLNSNVGMQVLKLDDQGNPFPNSSPNALHNEFAYDLPSLIPSKATSISYVNSPALTADVGIQIFGTASNYPGVSSSYAVSAYFNGETNCYRTLSNIYKSTQGPGAMTEVTAGKFGSLSACSNFQILAFFPGGAINYPCFGLMSSGSNQRAMPTGINQQDELNENFSVSPNPVSDKALINYSISDNSVVNIDVYDLLGQHIISFHPEESLAGTYQQELDFNSLNVKSGVYFVSTTVDGKLHKQKIVYTK